MSVWRVHVYPCVGSIFAGFRTPLIESFYAVYRVAGLRRRVPARELGRQPDLTHKCAWRMAHCSRRFAAGLDAEGPSGEVEAP